MKPICTTCFGAGCRKCPTGVPAAPEPAPVVPLDLPDRSVAPPPPGMTRDRWERLTVICRAMDAKANHGAGPLRKDT